ncbi:MAG: DNA-binding protein [Candidatus Competibacter denitrificans]|jgi:chromosome segregation ATPase
MARTGITFEDVHAAAESLLGRGLNPTIQRVREVLGTGSNTTISEHLKNWQQQLAEAPKIVLPPTVPEAVALALDTFWKIAVQHAEAAFDEQRTRAAQAAAAAEQARDAAISEQRQIQAEIEQLRRQLETAQTTARDFADRLLVEQERRANAEMAIQAAEQRVQAANDALDQIRAETAARVVQLETMLQQTRTDAEKQLTDAQQRFEAEKQRAAASEARLANLLDQLRAEQTTERQNFAHERQAWRQHEADWREQQKLQSTENIQLKANLAVFEEQRNAIGVELEQTRLALEKAQTDHLATVREAEALRGELKAVLAERERLQPERQINPSPNLPDADAPTHAQRSSSLRKPRAKRAKPVE